MRNNLYTPTDIFAVARNEAEVDNLLNTDIYKFMMLDFILTKPEYKDIVVRWKMTVRSKDVKTANVIPKESLIEQLEFTKSIKGISEADASYLRGMTRPDGQRLFREETIEFLKNFRLPEYKIGVDETDNYELEFTGPWSTSILWEIYGLKIINSLYLYHYTKKEKLTNVEFNQIINETLNRLYKDIGIFKETPELTFSEFGTRRSVSTDFQRMVFDILSSSLPNQCLGTSNVMLSREFGLANPRGTNAHELRMIPTALYDDKEKIVETMYDIDRQWANHFPGLSILLPDTYGSSFYFKNAPKDIIQNHNGCRFDSKDPLIAIPEYVDFLLKNNIDPKTKIGIPSDGLDAINSRKIYETQSQKLGKLTFGIGTNLTNNTKGTWPRKNENLGPFGSFSVVVKPSEIQRPDGKWVSCVKLSDNFTKATGEKNRVQFFKEIFGESGVEKKEVFV
ncbi:hypothetical protein HUU51_03935 [Candidatus Gracilibacteria bacterium]|nr:hypothetical protein [Candidatus Gracilibacteria bacterium]